MNETIVNLAICLFCLIMFLGAVIGFIMTGAWWSMIPGSMFGVMAYAHYVDDSYGIESVKSYLARKIK